MNKFIVCLLALFMHSFVFCAYSEDWSDCAYELDRLRRAATDAADAAEEAESAKNELESAKSELESAKDELESCRNWPDMYDLTGGGCQSQRWDYESALSDYQSKLSQYEHEVSNLESELDTIESRIRSV